MSIHTNASNHRASVIASVLFFALAACGGSSGSPSSTDDAPAARSGASSGAPTASGSIAVTPPATPSSTSTAPNPPPSAQDAGAPPATDAGVPPTSDAGAPSTDAGPPPIAKHCAASGLSTSLCLENTQGRAGDVVDVEVHLVPSAACPIADEGYVRFTVTDDKFTLANQADRVSCISRYENPPQGPSAGNVWWQGFGVNDIPGCPNAFGAGNVDVIKLKIATGTAPGDYPMHIEEADFISASPVCNYVGPGLDFTIRVLP